MSGTKILLDTNAIIALFDGNEIVKGLLEGNVLHISFVSEMEALSYQQLSDREIKMVESFIGDCIVLELSPDIKKLAIATRKKHKLKLPDAIIAATALYYQLPLVSADKAFDKVEDLPLFRFIP
jgi:predicted nucleic acid-binding protein